MMEQVIYHYKVESIHDIWPNLRVFVHGGVHFEPFRKGFEKIMSKPVVYMDSYLASEGFLVFSTVPNTRECAWNYKRVFIMNLFHSMNQILMRKEI